MNPSLIRMLTDDRTRELRGETPGRRSTISDGTMARRASAAMRLLRASVRKS